jgi:very-short-patch-repair endonuclease
VSPRKSELGQRPPHPDPLPPIEIGCCRFQSFLKCRSRVNSTSVGERERKRRAMAHKDCVLVHGEKVRKTSIARRLRRNATIAERRLWYRLRSRSLYGMKFVRQEPIGPYIVDFVWREHRLIVEVDGGQHSENAGDAARDRRLHDHGYRVLRFWDNDVIGNIEGVLETIASVLPHNGPAPSPPKSGLPDFGTLRRIEIGNSRFRLGGEGWGEGGSPHAQTRQSQTRGTPPSSRPSPPKGGEGERRGEG